jgi:ParB family chromosome partitioning protein
MAKQAFEAKRLSGWWLDPDDIVIIGLDTDDGPEHPLYDDRIKLPLNEEMIANLDAKGIINPVKIRKNGDVAECVAGRQRVRMAREINRRRKERNPRKWIPLLVPCTKADGDERSMQSLGYSENAVRTNDDVIQEARNMARMKGQGCTEEEIAIDFGCSKAKVLKRLGLLELATPVQRAVRSGSISPTTALSLKTLSHDEQKAKLDKLATAPVEHEKNGKAKRPTEQQSKAALGKRVVPGKKQAAKMVESGLLKEATAEEYLRYVAGEIPASKVKGLTAALRVAGLGE